MHAHLHNEDTGESKVYNCDAKNNNHRLVIEVVAGTGKEGAVDGALSVCTFINPRALCRYGDSLIVCDYGNDVLRMVEGVLGVADPLAESDSIIVAGYVDNAVPLIMTAIEVFPKEIARLTAQYARPVGGRVHIIAGKVGAYGGVDGPALSGAQFKGPICVSVDTTNPAAGPQLLIGQHDGRVRCLNIRTQMIATIAGTYGGDPVDGPASQARFGTLFGIAVAPNSVLFVADSYNHSVRRISAAKWPASEAPPKERMVTTLIGEASESVRFAQSCAPSFRRTMRWPMAMALHAPQTPAASKVSCATVIPAFSERDVGRLYVGCYDGVHVFDLDKGERKHFPLTECNNVTGLALTEDGVRLFAVSAYAVDMVDTVTGACTSLMRGSDGRFRAGPVTSRQQTAVGFSFAKGCVIDNATRSLVLCDDNAHRVVRLHGVDV